VPISRTKIQKKKTAPAVRKKSAVKRSRKPAVSRARKPKLAAVKLEEQAVDPKIISEHLSSLRSLSDLPPINLDDLIRNDQPYALMQHLDEPVSEEHGLSIRSRISFYLGVFLAPWWSMC
jgi:hypothetical protein